MCFRRTASWDEPGGDRVTGWVGPEGEGEGVWSVVVSVEEI